MKLNSKLVKAALLILTIIYCLIETLNHQDFDIFILATKDFLNGGNIYVNTYESGFHYFYGAIFASILSPLTFIPIYLARIIWIGINILALIRTWKLLIPYFDLTTFSNNQKKWFYAFCIFFSLTLVQDNLHNGQVTIILLLFMLEGLRLIESNKKYSGALLIALGISIKLLPLIIIPYLFFIKEFKAIALILLFFCIFLILPSFIIGFENNNYLLLEWWHLINPTNTAHVIDTDETTLNGLTTLIPTLFMEHVPDFHALNLKRNILDLNEKTIGLIINGIRLVLILLTLYFLRRLPFRRAQTKLHSIWELSYILLVIPMIFPHQQHYAFLLGMPASFYCIYWLFIQKSQITKTQYYLRVSLISLIYLCFNIHLILGEFREYYDHFKIISYGSILLVILISICKPNSKINNK